MIRLAIVALWGVFAGLVGRVWWSQRRYLNWLEHRLKEAQREEERVQPSGWEAEKVDAETKWKGPSNVDLRYILHLRGKKIVIRPEVMPIIKMMMGEIPSKCPGCGKAHPPFGSEATETTEVDPNGKPTS